MRRISGFIAIVVALLWAAAGPSTAAVQSPNALPVLSRSAPAGPPAAPGDLINSSLTPNTALSLSTTPGGSVGLVCKRSVWGGQLQSNPAAPGSAVIKLLSPFGIASCADSSPTVISVLDVTVSNLPQTFKVSDTSGYPLQIVAAPAPLQINVTLSTTGPTVTCVYQAANGVVSGVSGPGGAPWKFVNQPFKLVGGTLPACGSGSLSYLTAQYSPVLDTTGGTTTVYVN